MSNEIAVRTDTTLLVEAEQTYWTDQQVAALRHMGVEEASEGDLAVFFHVVKRSGLDPFARQIHMIGRNTKNQRTQQWEVKYTIQTGIDGYRLIGRRAADRTGDKVSVSEPQWAHPEGGWRDVWSNQWGRPLAAKVTVYRDGEPFPGVTIFEEYAQTKKDGNLTQMWAQRPAGQLAKCAEALAWRMAFPQDLAGIYTHEEMGQADSAPDESAAPQATAADFIKAEPATPEPPAEPVEYPQAEDSITSGQQRKMGALMKEVGITQREHALAYVNDTIGREVASRSELTKVEAGQVIDALEADQQQDDPGAPWPAQDALPTEGDDQ